MENVDNLGSLYMIILKNDGPSTQSFLLLLLKILLPMAASSSIAVFEVDHRLRVKTESSSFPFEV